MFNKSVGLWFLRKAVYVAAGAAVGVVANQVGLAGPDSYNLSRITLTGAVGGLGSALVGDLRRAFLPDLLQIATGQDPRSDG